MSRDRLVKLTGAFMAAFNRNDLDGVMRFFAEDAVYEEFNGRRSRGLAAIRRAFEPQFGGRFGRMEFVDEDLMVDAEAAKVMASWRCRLELDGEPTSWRGLDLLHFRNGRIGHKLTYAKAKAPLFEE